jgi:hypothetical protein
MYSFFGVLIYVTLFSFAYKKEKEKEKEKRKEKREFITHHSLNDNIHFGKAILRKMVIKTLKW